jgi:cell filamentation protein
MPDPADYWSADADPYIDPGTKILKNIPGLQTQMELDAFETVIFQGHFGEVTAYADQCKTFSFDYWQEIHGICFSDIYGWAGEPRTVRLSKGDTVFCYPENIASEAKKYFSELNELLARGALTQEKTAQIYAEMNVLHPFREGNGRTQRIMFAAILKRIGYQADYERLDAKELIDALIHAYHGHDDAIIALFRKITRKI